MGLWDADMIANEVSAASCALFAWREGKVPSLSGKDVMSLVVISGGV